MGLLSVQVRGARKYLLVVRGCGAWFGGVLRHGEDTPTGQLGNGDQRAGQDIAKELLLGGFKLDQVPQYGEQRLELPAPLRLPVTWTDTVEFAKLAACRRASPAAQPAVEDVLSAHVIGAHALGYRAEGTTAKVQGARRGVVLKPTGELLAANRR